MLALLAIELRVVPDDELVGNADDADVVDADVVDADDPLSKPDRLSDDCDARLRLAKLDCFAGESGGVIRLLRDDKDIYGNPVCDRTSETRGV